MVRENRVKEYIFSSVTVNGSTFKTYTDHVLNGEILKVRVQGISSPGSLSIIESGTNIEIWKRNNITSGLSTFENYPFIYGVDNTNVTGSPQVFLNQITNNILYISGAGFTSGTGTIFGPITLYYR